jgi:hypothetical protein
MTGDLAGRIRAICGALPEVTERPSHGAPTWFVRDKKSFVTLWADGHHDNQFPHLWCAAAPGEQESLTASAPGRFFRPPYVGHRGWLGVRLDGPVDWAEIAELCTDAYRVIAPGRLAALLDGRPGSRKASPDSCWEAVPPEDEPGPASPVPRP